MLVSPDMSDDEIEQKIREDMRNLASHEAGTKWLRLGSLLSGDSVQHWLSAGFKALVDQNKIMIRQNELILRALRARGAKLTGQEIKCTECGRLNEKDSSFCQGCGAKLTQLSALRTDPTHREPCPQCGYTQNGVADHFCGNCGKKL
jgi:hypothetical protein